MRDISQKEQYVAQYQSKLEKAKVVILANCEGVNVDEINALRKAVRESGSEIRVVKNTLLRRAFDIVKMSELDKFLSGSTAVTFGYADPISPVKALVEFADKCKKFSFKAGILEGKVLNTDQIKALSKLPGRKELLGMLASCMQGPIRNIVSVMQAPIRKLAGTLDAIREKKEKEAA